MPKELTQLTVSYNARTVSRVEEVQQIYQQTTRSRQKTARRPVAKKRDRPIHARSLLPFQIELKHIR
ncbi:hypothetical protein QUB63_33165 [Microcoleus sp. ARI1-B5]|uniref:hypothetical protein n=1 Tax=Microcoleus sp. ARI1-A1 TaxID=2818556 RepID=UPI002FD29B60